MTLYTNDYLEYYLTLVGWLINNGIWYVITDSGLYALALTVIIVQEWLKARGEGADEGNKGILSATRIENRLFVAIAVIAFTAIPVMDLSLNTLSFDDTRAQQCQVQVARPENTRWSASFTTLNNQSAQVPIWWYLVHAVSKAVTGAAVASIPCGTDLRQMRMEISTTRIRDPLLAQEVADFTNDCYGYSRARLFMKRPKLDEKLMNDINWIGSTYFTTQNGYYDTDYSRTPRVEWPYDDVRDAGLAKVKNGGGYPTCNQWWADSAKGLRAKLMAQIQPSLTERFVNWATFMSPQEVGDALIREIASPRAQRLTKGSVYTEYGGPVGGSMFNDMSRVVGGFGLGVGSVAYFPAMDVVRQAVPMVMALLKMTLIICIPIVLLMSTFDLKAVMTLSIIQFAMIFVDFWFQLARWLDTTILNALYGAGSPHGTLNPVLGMNNTQQDMLLSYVMAAMFIVLPLFWVGALSWAGISATGALEGLRSGTDGAQNAGSQGAGHIKSMVSKVRK